MRALALSVITVVAFGLWSATNRVSAQEEPPSQFEYIRGLEPFVGFWTGEAPEEEGESPVPVTLFCRLTGNRSYLLMTVSTQIEGERETIGTSLIGRDHAKDQVSLWGFWAGEQTHGKVEVGNGMATWSETGMRYDGRKSTANVTMKVEGDRLTVDVTDITHGDESAPDMHFTFTRSQRFGRGRGGQ